MSAEIIQLQQINDPSNIFNSNESLLSEQPSNVEKHFHKSFLCYLLEIKFKLEAMI